MTLLPRCRQSWLAGRRVTAGATQVRTVSNRADLVSGGDALVQLSVPRGAKVSSLRVQLNGHDVTTSFRRHSNGHGLGLLTGLRVGANNVTATLPNGSGARL